MSDPVVAPKRRGSVLLTVSLCVNLALIGLIAITYVRTGLRHFEPRHEGKVTLSAQSLIRMVPTERAKIQDVLDAHRTQIREQRQRATQARANAFRLLEADNFRASDFAEALAAVQSADAALETETMKVTAESVAVLTPAERETVAGQVKKPDRAGLRRLFRRR
jgi:uncharacterized membrane protein